jgi:hypothetical protein
MILRSFSWMVHSIWPICCWSIACWYVPPYHQGSYDCKSGRENVSFFGVLRGAVVLLSLKKETACETDSLKGRKKHLPSETSYLTKTFSPSNAIAMPNILHISNVTDKLSIIVLQPAIQCANSSPWYIPGVIMQNYIYAFHDATTSRGLGEGVTSGKDASSTMSR